MNPLAQRIQRIYLILILGNTLAASFIWGINTLFLLDAGLSSLEAFAANAFFTAGMVIFEIPTGIVADTWGRRVSYLLGTLSLAGSTLLYYVMWQIHAPFWGWAVVSMLLGLGYTFFSGAVEAWLVDALHFAKYTGSLEKVFGRGQIVSGGAMLVGSVAGGIIAQATSLGFPFLLRVVVLLLMFLVASVLMKDLGFTPVSKEKAVAGMHRILRESVNHGLKQPSVRWIMVSGFFVSGVSFFAFYAMQPYLLNLYGNSQAYSIAGLAAAIVAGSQILGGLTASRARNLFKKRTTALIIGTIIGSVALGILGMVNVFALALVLLVIWGLVFAALSPIRQAYLNGMIPSQQRATVLSFDSLVSSSGGVVVQPILGKAADVWSYGTSYLIGAAFQLMSVPFLILSRRQHSPADSSTFSDEKPPEVIL